MGPGRGTLLLVKLSFGIIEMVDQRKLRRKQGLGSLAGVYQRTVKIDW